MGVDMVPPFEHAFKEAISSRTHDYVTAEASLLVGVSAILYCTEIYLFLNCVCSEQCMVQVTE